MSEIRKELFNAEENKNGNYLYDTAFLSVTSKEFEYEQIYLGRQQTVRGQYDL
jgi:hypothetical protein